MVKKMVLEQVLFEQKDIFLRLEGVIEREVLKREDFWKICQLKEAVIITGVRRCGKSYLMKLIWQKIKEKEKLTDNNFLYVNFESEKMLGFTAKDFELLLETYFEVFSPSEHQKIYLFFDEIQNISGWEKFINRLLTENRYKIFITGSNASLLSKEISSALTGRNFPLQLFPLSFKEFCFYSLGRVVSIQDFNSTAKRAKLRKIWNQYVLNGGFPEIVKTDFRPLLEEYLRNIIYRDIVLRHHIKYESGLREIVLFLTSNIGAPLSLEKISRLTKIKNLMTVKNYLSYLEDSFLFYFVHKHSFSIKQQIYNPNKVYLCDSGLHQEIDLSPGGGRGRILENLMAGEFLRRNFSINYFLEKQECDFVLSRKNKVLAAVQVTMSLVDNREREINGLLLALTTYHLKNGLILTDNEEEEIKIQNKTIKIMPIYKWLLLN